jgi:hypothetical protein
LVCLILLLYLNLRMTSESNERGFDTSNIEYLQVPYPDNPDDLSNYNTRQRRKYLYENFVEEGQYAQNKTKLAGKFGVSRQQLHKDINKVRNWIVENFGEEFKEKVKADVEWASKKLREQERPYDLIKMRDKQLDILQEEGVKEKQPEKVEFENSGDLDVGFTITDDGDNDDEYSTK